jgi:adenosylcobinamide-GDP ribazoletransferase
VPARWAGRPGAGPAWFPVVGAGLGAVLALADLGLRRAGFAPLVASALVVVLLLGLTGALHADGLMDTCDAVFVPADRARRLAIMRDPHVGSFGVVGLVAVLVLKVAAVDALPQPVRSAALVVGPVLGRWAIVLAAALFPTARPGGLGERVRAASSRAGVAWASLVAIAACAWLGPAGALLAGATVVLVLLLGRGLTGLLGGLTGDNYGALCEVTEMLVWLLVAPLSRAVA